MYRIKKSDSHTATMFSDAQPGLINHSECTTSCKGYAILFKYDNVLS